MSTRHISLKVNGVERNDLVETRLLLVDYVRDTLGLTGAQRCAGAGCTGACTVLVDNWPICACLTLTVSVNGAALRTVEGFRCDNGSLHPLQQAFINHCPTLCSHCTAGILVSAMALLEANPRPTREDVRRALSGNICRCSGYRHVVDAVMSAAQKLHAAREVLA